MMSVLNLHPLPKNGPTTLENILRRCLPSPFPIQCRYSSEHQRKGERTLYNRTISYNRSSKGTQYQNNKTTSGNMANNGGRQGGGGGGNQQMNEHVEFTVKVRLISLQQHNHKSFLALLARVSSMVLPTRDLFVALHLVKNQTMVSDVLRFPSL